MLLHKTYETEEEKETIIAQMVAKGFTQVSTEGVFGGEGHLLFDDGKPEPLPKPVRDYGAEIDKIKAKLLDYDDLKLRVEKLEKK